MSYRVVEELFLLTETVGMLYRYVNGITYTGYLKRWKMDTEEWESDPRVRWMCRLQEIMEQVCKNVDPQDAAMQYFFNHVECGVEGVCLAQLLTDSFMTLEQPDYWNHVEEICQIWHNIQDQGAWIQPTSMDVLIFGTGPGCPGDLRKQLRALNYSTRFRMDLCKALEDFENTLWRLARLMEPIAMELKAIFERDPELHEELLEYWCEKFRETDPLQLLETMGSDVTNSTAGQETWVAVSLMNANLIVSSMFGTSCIGIEHNCFTIGSLVTSSTTVSKIGTNLDSISTVLKYISDKNRLEILYRLGSERSYGQALAEATGINPGNLSRSLSALHSYGFLRQKRERWRTYYETDKEALRAFLQDVIDKLCS